MDIRRTSNGALIPLVINLILGIWLIIAPFALAFAVGHRGAEWDSIIVGFIIAVIAALRIWGGRSVAWLSWVNVALGLWLIISAWVYGESSISAMFWNSIIVGVIVVILAAWAALSSPGRV